MPNSIQNNLNVTNKAQLIINSYPRERSPSPESSLSSASEPRIKRRKRITYLNGKGVKVWVPSCQFIVNEINLTKKLKKFRDQNIQIAEAGRSLSDVRILSLSHVFPVVKDDEDRCISWYLNPNEKEALSGYASELASQEMSEVSDEAILHCHKASKSKETTFEPKEKYDDVVLALCNELTNSRAFATNNSEAALMNKHLMPFITKILIENEDNSTGHAMMDTPCAEGKKPDFVLSAKTRKMDVLFFFVEVKRDTIDSKYQAESDFVKLMKQLKLSIDLQLQMGIKSPSSYGLLCEGFDCSFFKMVLAVEGVYLPCLVREFRLVRNTASLINIPTIVETLGFVKDELQQLKTQLENSKNKDKKEQKKLIKLSFISNFKK